MAEFDEPVEAPEEAMTRLEAALERIERNARLAAMPVPEVPRDESLIAARLDALITTLRNALAEATG